MKLNFVLLAEIAGFIYFCTADAWLYVAVVIYLFSTQIRVKKITRA